MNHRPRLRGPFALLLTLLLLLITHATFAAEITVTTPDDIVGDDGECSLREAVTAANTDAAFNGCPAGSLTDTITLPAGTYELTIAADENGNPHDNTAGDIDIVTPLVLQGAGPEQTILTSGPGFDDTLLNVLWLAPNPPPAVTVRGLTLRDGGGEGALWLLGASATLSDVHVINNVRGIRNQDGTLTLSDSTVMSNTGDFGAGIYGSGNGGTKIVRSTISHNQSSRGGGGIYVSHPFTATGSTIEHNRAPGGGGIATDLTTRVTLLIQNSTVAHNQAVDNAPDEPASGGGISSLANSTIIQNSQIVSNTAGGYGGGIFSLSPMTISNSTIRGNQGDLGGGVGTALQPATIIDSQIEGNSARSGAGIGNAGALTVIGGRIGENVAREIGGGIGNDGGTFFFLPVIGSATISGTLIENNQAERGAGIGTAGVFTLTNTTVRNNVASLRGGGLSIGNGQVTISGGAIRGNQAESGGGLFQTFQASYGMSSTHASLANVTIAGNTATTGGGVVAVSGVLTLTENSVLGNSAPGVLAGDDGDGDAATIVLDGTTLGNSGGNCATEGGEIVSAGDNQSSDDSCAPFFTAPGDENNVDVPAPGSDSSLYLPLVLGEP